MTEIKRLANHVKQTIGLYTKKARVRLITNIDGSYDISVEIPAGEFEKPEKPEKKMEEI